MDLPFSSGSSVGVSKPHGDGGVKHILQVFLCERGAFYVGYRSYFVRQGAGILFQDRPLSAPRQIDEDLDVLPQVALGAHQQHRCERTTPSYLRDPFFTNVLEGSGADDAEAQQEYVSPCVAEVTQLIEFVLRWRENER